MTPEEAIQIGDEALLAHAGNRLTDIQRMILRESLAGKGYEQMVGYDVQHIKNEGSQLWKLLSEALGERVSKKNFKGALEKRLRTGDIVLQPPMQLSYDEQTWVGREALIADLLPKLQGQTRLLWITGFSGIGKTTLGECLASKAWESNPAFQWIYLEILEGQSLDFSSVAVDLLNRLGDRDLDPQERNNPDQLTRRLLQKLQSHPYWIQIDALERLFNSEHPTEFVDAYWVTFLQRCLTHSAFASRLVLTSQVFPNALVEWNDRYPNVWAEIWLDGLLQVEQQLEFFAKQGIAVDSSSRDILSQIAKTYEGHPLVLKVIAEDILKDFVGDVNRYWQVYQREFEQVARELQAARPDETEYNEALDRKVRERIKKSLEQLPADALNLLCRSAVFRRPVPKTFWLAMIAERTPQQQKAAYYVLGDRALIEQEGIHQNQRLIRQHNLIRDIAYDLLREDTPVWETAERKAAELWLTVYEPAPDAPNLEKVRGYLEAFEHYCESKDWKVAKNILVDQKIGEQLKTWSYYQEMITFYSKLLGRLDHSVNLVCTRNLGTARCSLSNYIEAIDYYQQSLSIARKIRDCQGEGDALAGLGNVYLYQGNYAQAIDSYQQSLIIAREISDHQGEGNYLLGLGNVYLHQGNYAQAIHAYQQSLTIACEIDDYQMEGSALGNLGNVYGCQGNFAQAIECLQQTLTIACKDGNRNQEAIALGNLGNNYWRQGDYERAIEYHQKRLTIVDEIGDHRGKGSALGDLGIVYYHQGDYAQAIQYHQQRLTIASEIGDRQGEVIALGNLGGAYFADSNYPQAIDYSEQSLVVAREIGDQWGEGIAQQILGATQIKLEQYTDALDNSHAALKVFRAIGNPLSEAEVLKNLAELHQKTSEIDVAREYCSRALALAIELGIPLVKECEALKAQLDNER